MSNWPQAAWIVRKLQKNFDFSEQITYYTQNLNTLNGRVNSVNAAVAADEMILNGLDDDLAEEKSKLGLKCTAISAKADSSGNPVGYTLNDFVKGTIWLVQK